MPCKLKSLSVRLDALDSGDFKVTASMTVKPSQADDKQDAKQQPDKD